MPRYPDDGDGVSVQPSQTLDVEVAFQPIVSVPTGSAAGAEALLRGRIEGTAFPPRTLVRQLLAREMSAAELVLTQVAGAFDRWDDAGLRPVWCSINLDATELEHGHLDQMIADLVGADRARRIVVEVTELHPLDPVRSQPVLERLRSLGVSIAIDDFGVGESRLDQFELLQPDIVKIDRAFVSKIDEPGPGRAMVQVTLALARRAGVTVVAEGVERVGQLRRLTRMRCQFAQGYLFSPAVDTETFSRFAGPPASST